MKIKLFLSTYFRSIVIFILILLASTIPASEVQKVSWISIPNFDKIIHLGMYFCFTMVLILDISKAKFNFSQIKISLLSAFIALSYGGILEIVQGSLTKSRSADIFDFIFNVSGTLLAMLLWFVIREYKSSAKRKPIE